MTYDQTMVQHVNWELVSLAGFLLAGAFMVAIWLRYSAKLDRDFEARIAAWRAYEGEEVAEEDEEQFEEPAQPYGRPSWYRMTPVQRAADPKSVIPPVPSEGEVWKHTKTGLRYKVTGAVFNALTDKVDVTYEPLYVPSVREFTRQLLDQNEDGTARFVLIDFA
ncbi:hypothetical protein [Hyphomicrobium sp.]|uniref:hypothetical protein n=1 Tax=Hyphomicrobium sp. TaxID=82 RepID=UPI001DC558F1|nr:hypothetical protein [Hyphomicrobium sp.]MBY0560045.1 hypothetical protein [Hyphomicrobium sp.]